MTPNRLSVVLATFNGERYLPEQLESLRSQTRQPDELIVGDDGSADTTLSIVARFAKVSTFPVTIIRRQNVGFVANFLMSCEAAHSNVLAFADQDDIWHPSKLQRSLDALQCHDAALVMHGAYTVDYRLHPTRSGYPNPRRLLVSEQFHGRVWPQAYGNTMLFRRSLLDGCNWRLRPRARSGGLLNHDELVALLATVRGRTVRLPDRLLLYRQHDGNVAGARPVRLHRMLRIQSDNSAIQTDIVEGLQLLQEWAEYFCNLHHDADSRLKCRIYFDSAAAALRSRATRLSYPRFRSGAAILASALRGEYAPSTPASLGWGTFARDLYHCVGRHVP